MGRGWKLRDNQVEWGVSRRNVVAGKRKKVARMLSGVYVVYVTREGECGMRGEMWW